MSHLKANRIRHNRIGQYLHWCICKHYSIETSPNRFEHPTPPVIETKNVIILWDFTVHTDRTILSNRPDIIIKDRVAKTCTLLDMSVPFDCNVSVKEFDKRAKYHDLKIEIQKMWKLDTSIVPVIVGALGMIKNGTQEYLEMIPGNPQLQEI